MDKAIDKFMTIFITACLTAGVIIGLGCLDKELRAAGHGAGYWYQMFLNERSIRCAQSDLLHRIYESDDNDWWFDYVMATPEYWRVDSVLLKDWEDFYCYQEEYKVGEAPGDTLWVNGIENTNRY
jgi:hypothetical protein